MTAAQTRSRSKRTCHVFSTGLIKTLLLQLLDHFSFSKSQLARAVRGVNIGLLECIDDTAEFGRLFVGLVHQLPAELTLFCILDGIEVFEDPDIWNRTGVDTVLADLLSLAEDKTLPTNAKILITSPTSTRLVRRAIEDKNFVSLAGGPKMYKGFDDGRFALEFEDALAD